MQKVTVYRIAFRIRDDGTAVGCFLYYMNLNEAFAAFKNGGAKSLTEHTTWVWAERWRDAMGRDWRGIKVEGF